MLARCRFQAKNYTQVDPPLLNRQAMRRCFSEQRQSDHSFTMLDIFEAYGFQNNGGEVGPPRCTRTTSLSRGGSRRVLRPYGHNGGPGTSACPLWTPALDLNLASTPHQTNTNLTLDKVGPRPTNEETPLKAVASASVTFSSSSISSSTANSGKQTSTWRNTSRNRMTSRQSRCEVNRHCEI